MATIYEERQEKKARDKKYRKAAMRLSGGKVTDYQSVTESADKKCAFVEVIIEVPREEMEREE